MNEPQHRLGHGHLERLNHGCYKTAYLTRNPFLYCYNRSWDNNFGQREMWKILGFFKINFEERCFSLLTLFHLRKKHVFVTCNKILLNIIAKMALECKCDKCDSLWCKVCNSIIYGAKCNLEHSLGWYGIISSK